MPAMTPIEQLRYLMLATQREGNRFLAEALEPLGLTPAQAEALRVLQEWQPLALVELGSLLVCEQGSPSRLVAGLTAAGYVASAPSAEDKRRVVLTLTPRGEEAARAVAEIESRLYEAMGALLADQNIEALLPLLWRFVQGRPAGNALARRLEERSDAADVQA
jgi:DNA-binding MarR family transcriptional regulator